MRSVLALVAALAAVLSFAVTSASGIERPQTFSLLEVGETDTALGGSENEAPKPGDAFASTSSLYKWAGTKRGARVGRDTVVCTFLKVTATEQTFSADAHCTAGIFLPAGTILIEAFLHFTDGPGRFEVAVTGGTGAYANARGFVRIRDLGTGESGHSNLEFHLLP
jgi:hypothetical protein